MRLMMVMGRRDDRRRAVEMAIFPRRPAWGGTIMVPGNDYNTWTRGGRLTTGWHTLTTAVGHLTHRNRRDLDELLDTGKSQRVA